MSEITVKGLSQLNDFLQQLPAKLEKNVLRGAIRAGAKVVEAKAKLEAPVGPPSMENVKLYGDYEGALRDSIRVSVKVKGGKVIASVKAGGKGKADVFYAHFMEYGTAAHKIMAKGGKMLSFGGHPVKFVIHPGIAPYGDKTAIGPKSFMRPALESQAQAAVVAAAEYMRQRLATKEGMTAAADVEIVPQ